MNADADVTGSDLPPLLASRRAPAPSQVKAAAPGKAGGPGGRGSLADQDNPTETGVTVRYWAGARALVDRECERFELPPPGAFATVSQLRHSIAARHPQMDAVLAVSTMLRDGRALESADAIGASDLIDLLPPFAGG